MACKAAGRQRTLPSSQPSVAPSSRSQALRDLESPCALIGFDEVGVAEMVEPAISVIRQDTYEIGTRAIDLLLARLDGDASPARVEVVPSTLLARGSGEIPLTRDSAPAEPGAVTGRS